MSSLGRCDLLDSLPPLILPSHNLLCSYFSPYLCPRSVCSKREHSPSTLVYFKDIVSSLPLPLRISSRAQRRLCDSRFGKLNLEPTPSIFPVDVGANQCLLMNPLLPQVAWADSVFCDWSPFGTTGKQESMARNGRPLLLTPQTNYWQVVCWTSEILPLIFLRRQSRFYIRQLLHRVCIYFKVKKTNNRKRIT